MDSLKPSAANSCSLSPLTFLERAAVVYADSPSVIYNSTTYTWSDTNRRCLKAASAITSLGIGRGDVVSVVSPNVPAAYELHFAVPMAGTVLNNINTRLNASTMSVLLHHSEAKMVFVYHQLRALVLEAVSLLPHDHPLPVLVLISDEDDDSPITLDFCCTYEGLIERGDCDGFDWVRPTSEWDPIVLNYTSGTTASPKGVVHSHRGAFIMAVDSLINWSVPNQPVYLWTLPMFHSNGWSFPWGMAAVGGTNVCLRQFNGAIIRDAIPRFSVTHMCAAPVVLNMLIDAYVNSQPLRNPVHILTGGSPPPAPVLIKIEALGFVMSHGYGMTETGSVSVSCTWNSKWNNLSPTERARFKARQGVRTIGMTDMDVVDPNTRKSLARDGKQVGEICLKGGCVMLGYLKNTKETSKCMGNDGWLRTGDLGVIHPDGYLEIKDRAKDIIISGGENISSVEVESVLYSFPGVSEAAVVAIPHEHWGETPCLFVRFTQAVKVRPTERQIIEYCRSKLPHYMVPTKVVFQDELPKTSTGKIQKFRLREMARATVVVNPLPKSRL